MSSEEYYAYLDGKHGAIDDDKDDGRFRTTYLLDLREHPNNEKLMNAFFTGWSEGLNYGS
jgi:hypothetical protein